jgi:type I restriction enzyme S subunit
MGGEAFDELMLGDIADFRNGKSISPDKCSPYGKYPVFGANGQIARSDDLLNSEPVIAIGRVGAYCGSVHYICEPSWVTDNAIVVLPKNRNSLRFLFYLLRSLDIRRTAIGSAQPLMTQGGLKVISALVPPIKEQRAIAHILGTLDDKIELNRRMNETLEAIARAIFKSWFVDLDPVRAKAEGRDPGLPKHIADLFPDSFEDSELGEIPEEWRISNIGDMVTLSRSGLNPSELKDEVFDYFSIPAFDEGRTPVVEHAEAIKSNKLLVQCDSVLISKLNPRIPRVWLPELNNSRRAICSTEFFVALPKDRITREFIYFLFTNSSFMNEFATHVTGTSGSHQRVKKESLLNMRALIPQENLINKFSDKVKPIVQRINRNLILSRTLAALRDTLLPKLISGELRVPDAERIIKEANV